MKNYYMVAVDSSDNKIKHFRVDKMLNINILDKLRQGEECFGEQNTDVAHYAKKIIWYVFRRRGNSKIRM